MKRLAFVLWIFFTTFCAVAAERVYTGSTPASVGIRSFLGIAQTDSVDFIRWKLLLENNQYQLQCNYGIGKANTNGFVNGGTKIQLSGEYKKEKNEYQFRNGAKTLRAVELNADLLHLLDDDNHLLVGNGGWSFTLNATAPAGAHQANITALHTALRDSMVFEGRTPCGIKGVVAPGSMCYKLKWRIVLYADAKLNEPTHYKIFSTAWRKEGGKTGNWKITAGQDGQIIYQLNDENEQGLLYLLKLDEHILVFTDAQGKLLVGNEDFSYTLNRRQ